GEGRTFDLDDGQVRAFVAADQLGLEFAAVAELDRDFLGVLDHVVVGDDEAVARDEEARTGAGGQLGVRLLALARTARRAGNRHGAEARNLEHAARTLDA